jgi:hypothetical protein
MTGVDPLPSDASPEVVELRAVRAAISASCIAGKDRWDAATGNAGGTLKVSAPDPLPSLLTDPAGASLLSDGASAVPVEGPGNQGTFPISQRSGSVIDVEPACANQDPADCTAPTWAASFAPGGDTETAFQTVVDALWILGGLACGLFFSYVLYRSVLG